MSDTGELWRRIHESFEYHRKATDPDAQSAMDRIATKCIHSPTRRSFNANNCIVREELLSAASLHELKRYHSRAIPYHLNGPIVVLLYDGAKLVIEGNSRVNARIARQVEGPFSAIMVAWSPDMIQNRSSTPLEKNAFSCWENYNSRPS